MVGNLPAKFHGCITSRSKDFHTWWKTLLHSKKLGINRVNGVPSLDFGPVNKSGLEKILIEKVECFRDGLKLIIMDFRFFFAIENGLFDNVDTLGLIYRGFFFLQSWTFVISCRIRYL